MTSRAELARHRWFAAMSPEVGTLDEIAFADLLREAPDEALALLASMTAAMDRRLRERARSLAGRVVLDVARRGPGGQRRVGRMATVRFRPGGDDVDIDASLDALVTARAGRSAVDAGELRQRSWMRPTTAICLLLDRSGSMSGAPLATNAVAAAAVAVRNPDDFSIVSFARRPVVVKAQDATRTADQVIESVLALRGFGTTDLAAALQAAGRQLGRTSARRRITVLLSDCRATEPGDAVASATALDELVIIAPAGDDVEARRFAGAAGARIATVGGPSSVPDAFAAVLR
jgi:Mg-chelatase subunit ChlD